MTADVILKRKLSILEKNLRKTFLKFWEFFNYFLMIAIGRGYYLLKF